MKRSIIALAALALSACTVTTPPPPASAGTTPAPQVETVVLTGQRAFAVAELAYITAAKGVGIAADAGLIRGATATRVRALNAEARDWMVRGKATSDAAEQARAAARLLDIADAIDAITGRR